MWGAALAPNAPALAPRIAPLGQRRTRRTAPPMKWVLIIEIWYYASPEDLTRRLAASGFAVESIIGDWDGSPVGPESPEIVVTARLGA